MNIDPALLSVLSNPGSGALGLQRGIEKESLRVSADGLLSTQSHPETLGSPLTHPHITTDFSEAQLELITQVHNSPQASIAQLDQVHQFVYAGIGDELLWPSSMPCLVGTDEDIPIGRYGSSNIGMAKTVYRRGLGLRYGRLMQTISGIHYNFSLPQTLWENIGVDNQTDITRRYFDLIRNFRRWSWLLIYLFGASPAVCRSFTKNMQHNLTPLDEGSQYMPGATSLRMGPLGYQSSAQSELSISYNSLDEYARSMEQALTTTYPQYAAHGVLRDDEYLQLNTSILQIENEFYGTIRPKRPIRSGERPIAALRDRGVEYVEVRCLDLNPFIAVGINTEQIRFLDTFLLCCLLTDSPPDSLTEQSRLAQNQLDVVARGRERNLMLQSDDQSQLSLQQWGTQLLDACSQIAMQLDNASQSDDYSCAVDAQRVKVADPDKTPSAQVLHSMATESIPFFRFSMNQAIKHAQHFRGLSFDPKTLSELQQSVDNSFDRQRQIEAADEETFAEFLQHYLAL